MKSEDNEARSLKTADLAGAGERPSPPAPPEHDTSIRIQHGNPAEPERHVMQQPIRPPDSSKAQDTKAQDTTPLVDRDAAHGLQSRWSEIQGSFVDEPRKAVAQADNLVAETMQQVAENFSKERSSLEAQWDRGAEVSTEDLRQALQHYRSFFNRLLAA